MMKHIACEQNSAAWFAARLGYLTASRVADIMPLKSGAYPTSRATLMDKLLAERLTKVNSNAFVTKAMEYGTATEPQARRVYAFERDVEVNPMGFVLHAHIEGFGASPDGLVVDGRDGEGLVEIKCPETWTHIRTLRTREVDVEYVMQVQAQLACTGLAFCDFVSFDPRLPEEAMQLYIQRLERDDQLIRDIEREASLFLEELQEEARDLLATYRLEAAS
jgi:putative phage-type endonuclease